MKRPVTLQEKWLKRQMQLTKMEIQKWKRIMKESDNIVFNTEITDKIKIFQNDLKMQNVIYTQITNYKALK